MAPSPVPRAVVVTRRSDLEGLVARHGTREQARFFLERRGQSIEGLERRHEKLESALRSVSQAIPSKWRRVRVLRDDLSRFVFEPADVVVAVGQDGLVANVAKYLSGQPVLGVNPDPESYDGVLVPHRADAAKRLLAAVALEKCGLEERTMVDATSDDGQRLRALNEIFVGHRTHQSARYRLRFGGGEERQSSSGLIVATGTGATGWARSIDMQRARRVPLPGPSDPALVLYVREPFPSVSTGTRLAEGLVRLGETAEVISEMNEGGVAFGDGIEDDRIDLGWGVRVRVDVAGERLRLVR